MANLFRLRVNLDYLRFLLKRNQRFVVLMSAGMLVLYPVLYLTIIAISQTSTRSSIRSIGQVLDLILLIASSVILPMLLHSYLNRKRDLDVYHALPIKQGDLFSTHIIASIVLMVIPFTLGWAVGGAVSMNQWAELRPMVEVYVTSLLICTAILSIVTFTLMHVGTSVDGLLYAALLNVLPLIAYLSYNLFRSVIFLGFNQAFSMKVIGMIFPVWALFENALQADTRMFANTLLNGVYWGVIALILLGLSRYFYAHRKHERAESPFTSPYFFPIISAFFMVLLVFILYSAFYSITAPDNQSAYNPINFIFPFFFAGLVYLVMDTISQRSFKNLYKAMIRYLLISLVSFSLLLVGLFTKGFGYVTWVPKADEVASIEFTYDDYSNITLGNPTFYADYFYPNNAGLMTIKDAQGIQTVLDYHQVILDEYRWVDYSTQENYRYGTASLIKAIEQNDGYSPSYESLPYIVDEDYVSANVTITYHLKDGRTVARQYFVPAVWGKGLMALYESPAILPKLSVILAEGDIYSVVESAQLKAVANSSLVNLKDFDLKVFTDAYLTDLDNLDEENFSSLQGPTTGYLALKLRKPDAPNETLAGTVVLNDNFPLSLTYLSSLGGKFPETATDLSQATLTLPDGNEDLIFFHKAWENGMNASWYTGQTRAFTYVNLSLDQVKAILPYTTQVGISDDASYSLRIVENASSGTFPTVSDYSGQGNFLVKPEYKALVEAIIADNPRLTTAQIGDVPPLKQ